MKSLPIAGQGSSKSMGFAEALESPCETCPTSPCCTHLPLHTFKVDTLVALDHARYLLGFRRIQLGISAAGDWSVYYRHPCRYLDRDSFGCTVHDSLLQPQICVHYNPYSCWYKRSLSAPVSEGFVPIDHRRLDFILEHVRFDENRTITEVPDWPTLLEVMKDMPLDPVDTDEVDDDPVFDQWLEQAATGQDPQQAADPQEPAERGDPCTGCAAHCCKTLVFPGQVPSTMAALDFMRFALGFPGVEVAVSDQGWSFVVKTTCRHLTEDNRCGVYGAPERPLLCKYYDAQSCHYKAQFGVPRPAGLFRFRLEQWHWVVESFKFDDNGVIVEGPSTDRLRRHVEERWRAEVMAAAQASGADADTAATSSEPEMTKEPP
ncbi:hypothetical protein [Haliangium sp.]|uniref:hypothetical protein n=1 Tax=Haliangium sp. TaxID=2663208 RepID=UPI003D0AB329